VDDQLVAKLLTDPGVGIAFDRDYVERFGLAGFLRLAWHEIEPAGPLAWNWHLDELCEHTEALYDRRIKRLLINVPPSTLKSVITSVAGFTHAWIKDPKLRFTFSSYDAGLVQRDARKSIEVMRTDWFRARWPHVVLLGGNPAVGNFSNTAGGWRFSAPIKGKMTGRHPDIQVVDDPIKAGDTIGAASVTGKILQYVIDWWRGTMATRGRDPKELARLVSMQRLAENDLSGYLESGAEELYECLRLPMRFDASNPSRTSIGGDRRKVEGELLFPQRFPEEIVKALEIKLGIFAEAQLQQRPARPEGETFKLATFRYWTPATLPTRWDQLVWSWDCAFKDNPSSDMVAGQLWGKRGSNYYLLAGVLDRLSFADTTQIIKSKREDLQFGRVDGVVIEDKANGPAIVNTLANVVSGIVAVSPDGGKEARANACSWLFRAGNVFFPPRAPQPTTLEGVPEPMPLPAPEYSWAAPHEAAILKFPRGKIDDPVDAMTQMLLFGEQAGFDIWRAVEEAAGQRKAG
jgi:predicted phage terminase large subunit-like protein